jgi:hypothetical protein
LRDDNFPPSEVDGIRKNIEPAGGNGI